MRTTRRSRAWSRGRWFRSSEKVEAAAAAVKSAAMPSEVKKCGDDAHPLPHLLATMFCCCPPPPPDSRTSSDHPISTRGISTLTHMPPPLFPCRSHLPPLTRPPSPLSPLPQCPSALSLCPATRTSVHAPAPARTIEAPMLELPLAPHPHPPTRAHSAAPVKRCQTQPRSQPLTHLCLSGHGSSVHRSGIRADLGEVTLQPRDRLRR